MSDIPDPDRYPRYINAGLGDDAIIRRALAFYEHTGLPWARYNEHLEAARNLLDRLEQPPRFAFFIGELYRVQWITRTGEIVAEVMYQGPGEKMQEQQVKDKEVAHVDNLNSVAPANEPRFIDTPVLAAKRRAFDYPNQANLDTLIAAVRAEARQETEKPPLGHVIDCHCGACSGAPSQPAPTQEGVICGFCGGSGKVRP
jgi:hypothetical protein